MGVSKIIKKIEAENTPIIMIKIGFNNNIINFVMKYDYVYSVGLFTINGYDYY